jgi:serine/threonine protein kinase
VAIPGEDVNMECFLGIVTPNYFFFFFLIYIFFLSSSIVKGEKMENLNSSLQARILWSKIVDKTIKKHMEDKKISCKRAWEQLFTSAWYTQLWKSPVQLGKGQYGSVYKVYLQNEPKYPLAVKVTNQLQLNEAKQTLMVSVLTEIGVNPHFPILYAHFHCEKLSTSEVKKHIHANLIPWNTGMMQIRTLEMQAYQIQQSLTTVTNPDQRYQLEQQYIYIRNLIPTIFRTLYADDDTVKYFKQLKKDKEKLFKTTYSSEHPELRTDQIYQNDLRMVQEINHMYQLIQENRKLYYKPFELIIMELADYTMSSWLKTTTTPRPEEIISASFQICSAFLSLIGFFKLIQNDLLLHNIMYSQVLSEVYYVYHVKNTYFKVPLFGKLFKIIDFGLSTTTNQFYNTPQHWCPGGRSENGNDGIITSGEHLQCASYVRDILEYFFNLKNKSYKWSKNLQMWIEVAYETAKKVDRDNMDILTGLFFYIFSPETLTKYKLPPIIETNKTGFPLHESYQSQVFDLVNVRKYKKTINRLIDEKIWEE